MKTTRSTKHVSGRRSTSSAVEIVSRLASRSPAVKKMVEQERDNLAVALQVHAARTSRNLTQAQLARLVGTTQSVIARLEDADYTGHSLTMLRRIGAALDYDLEIRFVDSRRAA
ncbi:MAG: XRE family transcriptional regulator [Phycisphaeraceae bacterium]|nr:XRE family transcriptional regulator [Phycisphaeraceae bacterium]MBX3405239.1 XRE family transcriptional regulator [Phycisphaeraceae bacterium]